MKHVVDNNSSIMYCSAIQIIKAQQAYSKTDITMSHLVASLNRKVIIRQLKRARAGVIWDYIYYFGAHICQKW